MLDDTLAVLRQSPRMARFFEADGSLVSVRGGSDVPPAEPAGGDAPAAAAPDAPPVNPLLADPAPEPAATPDPAAAPASDGAAAYSGDAGDTSPEGETFPRSYVEELRQESAKYRTKAKTFEEAFSGYDDDSREAFLSLAKDLLEAPEDAAKRMLEVSRNLLGDQFDTFLAEDPTDKPLTAADVDRIMAEREQKAQADAAVKAVEQEARDLGYTDGSPDIAELFWHAHNETGGDLKAAHEKVQARKQAIIDEYLAQKQADGSAFPVPTTAGVGADQGADAPKDFADAKARTLAMLAGEPGV